MQQGQISFTRTERVLFGQAVTTALPAEADRLGAQRVYLLVSRTLNRESDVIDRVRAALGARFAGLCDHMPAHSPREAVIACARDARSAGADLLVNIGGGSTTDGAKAVTLCASHAVDEVAGIDRYIASLDGNGRLQPADFPAPDLPLICVPTTLSGGEFNPRAGITNSALGRKQSIVHPGLAPRSIILDPDATRPTPEWLWLSTGIRAVDHAVESFCSLNANDYVDGAALQALRLLAEGLPRVKADPEDLEARLKCQMGAWLSMSGPVLGVHMGASHAIGHILGGSAGVPHGHTSCVMLPAVLRYNESVNGDRQKALAAALGRPGEAAADLLHELIAGLALPRRLADVGVEEAEFERLAGLCMHDAWTHSNPRPIAGPEQIVEILRLAA